MDMYFIERLSGRFKIHRKGTNGSKSEQIATADSEEDATLITTALNERERLRELLRDVRLFLAQQEIHHGDPICMRIDRALNEQKGESP